MGTAEIKQDIFRKLDQLDPDKLNEAYSLFLNYINSLQIKDDWGRFTDEQKKHIEKALNESEEGLSEPLQGFTDSLRKKYKL